MTAERCVCNKLCFVTMSTRCIKIEGDNGKMSINMLVGMHVQAYLTCSKHTILLAVITYMYIHVYRQIFL